MTHQSVESGGEFGFRQRERVAQVQTAVHVRVRESHHELGFGRIRRFDLKDLLLGPECLSVDFDRPQRITLNKLTIMLHIDRSD